AFIREDLDAPREITTMPGVHQETHDSLIRSVEDALRGGCAGVVLFGIPAEKDAEGSQAWADHGVVQTALRRLRSEFRDECVLIADCCLDEYTDHGHCGVLLADGRVDNDATLDLYARIAVSQAAAGADVIAPSGMMDGQVAAIRQALDDVVARVRDATDLPLAAYSVSGEYAMLRAAAAAGAFEERAAVLEALTAIRRAGADMVITYHARQVVRWLAEDRG